MIKNHQLPSKFPESWASDWGEDQYGIWMALFYKKVRVAFRWIPSGQFLMGSPEDEKGRLDRETQHLVIITEGFWLAETACTQALWQVITGDDPSRFKGDNRPVERVSWDDVQGFIQQSNGIDSIPSLRLPSEAEWEYACRAGTRGAFNFEGNLSLDTVNYRGTWEWSGENKQARQETVNVKAMNNPNHWGLHEMHGNVYEWSQDYWQESLGAEPAQNPTGTETGDDRVLRGGSWRSGGGRARSGYRHHYAPSFRHANVGFRLALGL